MTTTTPPLLARLQLAVALHQQGRLADARAHYESILAEQPRQPDALNLLGVIALQSGNAAAATELIGRAIAVLPAHPEFHLNHAHALQALGRLTSALDSVERALALKPTLLQCHLTRATLLCTLGRTTEAIASYEQLVVLRPDLAEAHFNLANLLRETGRLEAAAARYEQALTLKPDLVPAHVNGGVTQLQLGRADAALNLFDKALALQPGLVEAHIGRGNALLALQRWQDAIASYDRALAQRPGNAEALRNRGRAQYYLEQDTAAVASLEAALALQPDDVDALVFLGSAYSRQFYIEAALTAFERVIALQPDHVHAHSNRGILLHRLKRLDEAVPSYEKALALQPDFPFLPGNLMLLRQLLCDWRRHAADTAQLAAGVAAGKPVTPPFPLLMLVDSPALLRQAAGVWACERLPLRPELGPLPPRRPGEKIRLGYFSADFRNHPVARLTAALFEQHDREHFEVIGFAFGPPSNDPMRQRLEQAFDRLIDVAQLSDQQVAALAREQGIDIAIDLGGYTEGNRAEIFTYRAAPVQVSYIGFLGSMGADWMDYLIADPVLIPPEQREHYAEKILTLPWYQANEERYASDRAFSRAELGLPATGIVLASLNNQLKISPEVFACWMRILTAVPDSVLYLLVDAETARRNLRVAAEAHGVRGERLHFADRMSREDYLARYRVVDLFLDTWPCNAGATASDALYMDVPVLTCLGQSFASRIAASVITALEMPELITSSPEEYEHRAIALARAPDALAALKRKVEAQRQRAPLYDTARFTRYLEAGFRAMHDRRTAGLAPDDIDIAP